MNIYSFTATAIYLSLLSWFFCFCYWEKQDDDLLQNNCDSAR